MPRLPVKVGLISVAALGFGLGGIVVAAMVSDIPTAAATQPATSATRPAKPAKQERVDLEAIERIKAEARERSQVMELASWLTDVYGARLTGSPITKAAGDWAVATMKSWGLSNVHLEEWGPYEGGMPGERWGPLDRGWTNERFAFRALTPYPFIIHAVPSVYSTSTNGRITGPAVLFNVNSFEEMTQHAGRLKGAFLLMDPPRGTPAHFEPQATRRTDAELEAMASVQRNLLTGASTRSAPRREPTPEMLAEVRRYNPVKDPDARRWLANEGVAVLLYTAPGDGGNIVLAGRGGGWRTKDTPDQLPSVKVSAESYGRLARILEKKIPVTLELDMQNTFYDDPEVFNIVAEIPGSDPQLKDEIVMIGAHFDSWTFGTGATDNAAGVSVMMEAMRILKTLQLQPRRTVRVVLWTGHEQGGLGTNAYVKQHFQDWVPLFKGNASPAKPEHERFSVIFNMDNGTGKIRGIYQQGNEAAGPIFDAWMAPFKEMGMQTVALPRGGGPDHRMFERVGLPGFGFIQDPIEYNTRTHHSSVDVYERLQAEDLRFNSAVVASFAWQAAQRDEKFPRKPPRW